MRAVNAEPVLKDRLDATFSIWLQSGRSAGRSPQEIRSCRERGIRRPSRRPVRQLDRGPGQRGRSRRVRAGSHQSDGASVVAMLGVVVQLLVKVRVNREGPQGHHQQGQARGAAAPEVFPYAMATQ
jgi:hypothetical protein